MQDYWNDPPDYDEAPEWFMTLEDIIEQMDPPQAVADAIRKVMNDFLEEENKRYEFEPFEQ